MQDDRTFMTDAANPEGHGRPLRSLEVAFVAA
jgi:hypothetical protein